MSHKSDDTVLEILLGAVVIFGTPTLAGWVFMLLWNFALVGLFPSIPTLDFWRSVGCVLFLSFISSFFRK